jgi:SAM-dependent methyltransferase
LTESSIPLRNDTTRPGVPQRDLPIMGQYFKKLAAKVIDKLADRIAWRVADMELADSIAYRVALETILNHSGANKKPNELFSGISDGFWFWLCTEGYRRNPSLASVLPGMPEENVQLMFTGDMGDSVLREGFSAYRLFKEVYESHVGCIAQCCSILDFGCGWGRIIRFFLKDVEPSRLWGVDPVEEMVDICKKENKWCHFESIGTKPPSSFQDNTFDLIYSFSVFSHLSEEMHRSWLVELSRMLKPGGLLVVTTRGREFIEYCAELRKREDLDSMHEGPRSSAFAFLNTQECLSVYDSGAYCFGQLVHEKWSYWGEAAISKDYVLSHWVQFLTFCDYIDDRKRCTQNVIVMKKTVGKDRNE